MRLVMERWLFRVAIALTIALSLVTFAVLAWMHRRFTVDDAYITLRYSANLAHGDGPTWNPGQAPAEGYTTFAWMVLMAIPHLLGLDALHFAKLTGVLAAVGAMVATGSLAYEIAAPSSPRVRVAAAAVAIAALGMSTSTAVHAVSGMETTLFLLFVTAYFARALAWAQRAEEPPKPPFGPALLALGAALTRPEGNVLPCVVFGIMLVMLPTRRRALARAAVLAWILPYSAYLGWRLHYYGLAAPLAFYVKVTNEPGTFRGVGELVDLFDRFVRAQPYLGVFLVMGLVARWRSALPMVAAVIVFLGFFSLPAPIMAYEHRYLYPVVPALFALAGAGAAVLIARLARGTSSFALAGVTLAIAALAAVHAANHARASVTAWSAYGDGLRRAHVQLGRDLRARAARTVALVDVGAVAYESGCRVIDTFGLNEPVIARSGEHSVSYVQSRDPDVVVFISKTAERLDPHLPWEAPIHDSFVGRGYRHMATYTFAPDYFLLAFARP